MASAITEMPILHLEKGFKTRLPVLIVSMQDMLLWQLGEICRTIMVYFTP
jgi:hypothetical protein